jgi:hypothetical protein
MQMTRIGLPDGCRRTTDFGGDISLGLLIETREAVRSQSSTAKGEMSLLTFADEIDGILINPINDVSFCSPICVIWDAIRHCIAVCDTAQLAIRP